MVIDPTQSPGHQRQEQPQPQPHPRQPSPSPLLSSSSSSSSSMSRPLPPWPIVSPAGCVSPRPHNRRECPGAPIQQKKSRSRIPGLLEDERGSTSGSARRSLRPRRLFVNHHRDDDHDDDDEEEEAENDIDYDHAHAYDVDEYRATSLRRGRIRTDAEEHGRRNGNGNNVGNNIDNGLVSGRFLANSPPASPVQRPPASPAAAAAGSATRIISPHRKTSNDNNTRNATTDGAETPTSTPTRDFEGRIRSVSTLSNTSQHREDGARR